jgi:hypothetical protein
MTNNTMSVRGLGKHVPTEPDHEKESECPCCHNHNVTDDWVFVCTYCGAETCPDCAGRCGCDHSDMDD